MPETDDLNDRIISTLIHPPTPVTEEQIETDLSKFNLRDRPAAKITVPKKVDTGPRR